MRMDRTPGQGLVISGLSPAGFRIDDGVYHALLMTPERADGWTPPPLDALTTADLASLLALDPAPEFLLIGTGPRLVRPAPALVQELEGQGIGVEAMDSRAAARAWGVLRAEGRWIGAALYPHS
ncbi:Mth938-like domain-containing protein [Sphingomonas aracearum]|uniref:Xcc1710-like domain-containing protein n=1 Tax=Sphingomonas aracearum TaxID=2283317 RepID=A0A369VZA8_9SPHN|nr:Mth938-like domain-containing protein [Sphingomonas aracearum]RDE07139.1 hypothetical protein DVW87_05700 [Sphingomonas aracearum]